MSMSSPLPPRSVSGPLPPSSCRRRSRRRSAARSRRPRGPSRRAGRRRRAAARRAGRPGLGAGHVEPHGQPGDRRAPVVAGHGRDVVAVRAGGDDVVGGSVGAERDAERGQVGAADVVGDEPVGAAERGRVDPLDAVEVHHDVADVAGEPHAPAVRRHVEDLATPEPLKVSASAPAWPSTCRCRRPGPRRSGRRRRRATRRRRPVAVDGVVAVTGEDEVAARGRRARCRRRRRRRRSGARRRRPGARVDRVVAVAAVDGQPVVGAARRTASMRPFGSPATLAGPRRR